jgi:hypothetical protein
VHQNVPGAFVVPGPRAARTIAVVAVVLALLAAACGGAQASPKFGLVIQNASSQSVRLNLVVTDGQKPASSLRIPSQSGILKVDDTPMTVANGKPVPVVVEVYSETCALLTSVTVGAGRTTLFIGANLAVTKSASGSDDASGALTPATAAAC